MLTKSDIGFILGLCGGNINSKNLSICLRINLFINTIFTVVEPSDLLAEIHLFTQQRFRSLSIRPVRVSELAKRKLMKD